MRRLGLFMFGIIVGLVGAGVLLMVFGAGLMLEKNVSPVGIDETVKRIKAAAEKEGWKVLDVMALDESVRKHKAGEVRPVRVLSLCQPHHAAKILGDEGSRHLSVMMPCRIALYEQADGKVYISTMNAGLMGRLFGGVVSEVMGGPVAESQQRFVDAAIAETK